MPDGPWDLSWLDQLKGKHKQVFDTGNLDFGLVVADELSRRGAGGLRDGLPGCEYGRRDRRQRVPVQRHRCDLGEVRGRAPLEDQGAGHRAWATRNIYVEGTPRGKKVIGVKPLLARGTIFWQCNNALNGIVARVRGGHEAAGGPGARGARGRAAALGEARARAHAAHRAVAGARLHVRIARLSRPAPARRAYLGAGRRFPASKMKRYGAVGAPPPERQVLRVARRAVAAGARTDRRLADGEAEIAARGCAGGDGRPAATPACSLPASDSPICAGPKSSSPSPPIDAPCGDA